MTTEKTFPGFLSAEKIKFTGKCRVNFENRYRITYMLDGKWHRVDGPADFTIDYITKISVRTQYWINDHKINSEEDYWNHPLVMKNKLNSILAI